MEYFTEADCSLQSTRSCRRCGWPEMGCFWLTSGYHYRQRSLGHHRRCSSGKPPGRVSRAWYRYRCWGPPRRYCRSRSCRVGQDPIKKFISGRVTISQLKNIQTDVGVVASLRAVANIGVTRETTIGDQPEVIPDGGNARSVVGTEPAIVPVRVA